MRAPRTLPWLLLLAAAALAGCTLIVDTRGRCQGDSDCLRAQHCESGFCVEGPGDGGDHSDGGDAGDDGGIDGGTDAGTDGGTDGGSDGGCTSETNAGFCTRLMLNCGAVSGTDNCGQPRSTDCGTCTCGTTCTSNTCTPVTCLGTLASCQCNEQCCSAHCSGNLCCKPTGVTAGCGPNPADTYCVCDQCCSGCSKNNQCVASSNCASGPPTCAP